MESGINMILVSTGHTPKYGGDHMFLFIRQQVLWLLQVKLQWISGINIIFIGA